MRERVHHVIPVMETILSRFCIELWSDSTSDDEALAAAAVTSDTFASSTVTFILGPTERADEPIKANCLQEYPPEYLTNKTVKGIQFDMRVWARMRVFL